MLHICPACQRTIDYPEPFAFCPFCGASYAHAAPAPAMPGRIVIGSDSERTVQEKYWKVSHLVYQSVLDTQQTMLDKRYPLKPLGLDFMCWLIEHRQCPSVRQFIRACDAFLQQLQDHLSQHQPAKLAKPIDLEAERERIDTLCLRMAQAVGSQNPEALRPQWDYQPMKVQPEEQAAADETFTALLNAVQQVKPIVYHIFQENGIFSAFSSIDQLEDRDVQSPAELTQRLLDLSQKDYDPLFGEQYDELILSFWRAMRTLTHEANRTDALLQLDQCERSKLNALKKLLHDWRIALHIQLDKAYQSQQLNMIHVYSALSAIQTDAGSMAEKVQDIENEQAEEDS